MYRTNPTPRYFLSFFLGLLPLFTALSNLSHSPESHTLGMGTPASVSLEPTSKRVVLPPTNQDKTDTGYFEVAQLSPSAAQWRLAGRFLKSVQPSFDTFLLLFGKLQLEGG